MLLLLTMASATAGGLLAPRLKLPGGAIVGAMVGAAVPVLAFGEVALPEAVRLLVFVGVGMMIGMLVTRETVRALPATAGQAVLSAVALIICGVLVTLLLRALGIAPLGDVLATSPGALSVLSAAAAENDLNAPTVALFHIVRIVLILVTLPLLVKLLPERAGARSGAGGRAPDPVPSAPGGVAVGGRGRGWRASPAFQLAVTAGAAGAGGLLAVQLGISGAMIFGTTVGAALVTLAFARPRALPAPLRLAVQIALGWMVGTLVTPDTLAALRSALLPAVLSAVLVITSGLGIAFALRRTGHAPPGDVLATSPGALEALASTAVEHDAGAVQVALFHTVRLLLVILSLPLLLALLP